MSDANDDITKGNVASIYNNQINKHQFGNVINEKLYQMTIFFMFHMME